MIHNLRKRFVIFSVLTISVILLAVSLFILFYRGGEVSLGRLAVTGVLGIGLTLLGSLILSKLAIAPVQKAWQRQLDFTADASHELRTPLAVIRTNLELVMDSREESVASQMKWLNNIDAESRRMTDLIDALLTLSRADTDSLMLEKSEICMEELIEETGAVFAGTAERMGIHLHIHADQGLRYCGDRNRLKQMLIILTDNAFLYSGASNIVVKAAGSRRQIEIRVSDDGVGIEKEHLKHLFSRFYRATGTRAKHPQGAGLGLAIAKWIVEEHGGKIEVSSIVGRGTEFVITLPVRLSPEMWQKQNKGHGIFNRTETQKRS